MSGTFTVPAYFYYSSWLRVYTCLSGTHCSLLAPSAMNLPVVDFASYRSFDIYASTTDTVYKFEQGQDLYDDSVCPTSTCSGVLVTDFASDDSYFTCPSRTTMVVYIYANPGYTGAEYSATFTPPTSVKLMNLPAGCTGGTSIVCPTSGGNFRLAFAQNGTDCRTPGACLFPSLGTAYGSCAIDGNCSVAAAAADIYQAQLSTNSPTTARPVTQAPTRKQTSNPTAGPRPTLTPTAKSSIVTTVVPRPTPTPTTTSSVVTTAGPSPRPTPKPAPTSTSSSTMTSARLVYIAATITVLTILRGGV